MKFLKYSTATAMVTLGVMTITLRGGAVSGAASPHVPPNAKWCVPFLNNLDQLGSIDAMWMMPVTATLSTGATVANELVPYTESLAIVANTFSLEATRVDSASRKTELLITAADMRTEVTHVKLFIKALRSMTAAKNPALLKMANADVSVDANESCLVWAQQLNYGHFFATATISLGVNVTPNSNGPNSMASAKGLRRAIMDYPVNVVILSASPKRGLLRSAKIAITASNYTVDVCMTFSGTHPDETSTTAICGTGS